LLLLLLSLLYLIFFSQVGLRHDQYKIAVQRLAQRETLWEVAAACAQLQLQSDAHHAECRQRLDKFIVSKQKKDLSLAYFADPSREPQLRAVSLAVKVYEEAGGKLPEGLGNTSISICFFFFFLFARCVGGGHPE
jgi:hypothetical protein